MVKGQSDLELLKASPNNYEMMGWGDQAGETPCLTSWGLQAGVSPTDLPLKLAELSLKDGPGAAQSPTGEDPQASVESSSEGSSGS
ncbi:hypothetical protein N1851_025756 [Merluccius polli]|uniref:Uncharacterized protein n=1 Tax=Merluccius polli TaxID=89951 RepID=A0AA47MD26_MERPO|nr:hypothetical protein N1851_025756 [Merluccius polli]